VGRPWWYDNYRETNRPVRRRFQIPRRQLWVWIALVLLAIILTANTTGFEPVLLVWLFSFVYYICRILTYAIIARAILSWFVRSRQNLLFMILDDITEPLLAPLRRIIPRFGMFDLSPLAAIVILYLITLLLSLMVRVAT
jgi:YggT family protein